MQVIFLMHSVKYLLLIKDKQHSAFNDIHI